MAKNALKGLFNKKKDEDKSQKPEKKRIKKNKKETLWNAGAGFIEMLDEVLDEAGEMGEDGKEAVFTIGASIVDGVDGGADVISWFVSKTFIILARRGHNLRMKVHVHRRQIVKYTIGTVVVTLGLVAIFASAIEYEYSYNGRTLGIVHEQRDVLEILDMVSEELSKEYGSSITIDPETDIRFQPVLGIGKDIDDADTVLKRFTYMGDIQAQAYAINVNGAILATVESRLIAEDVLQAMKDLYVDPDDADKYEYIGFAEDIKIEEYNTTLANINSKSAAIKKLKAGAQQETTYEVESGDTLYGICDKLGISLDELKEMNPRISDSSTLHIGDEIISQKEVPLITVETVRVTTFAEKIKYETIYKESDSYYVGDSITTRAGQNGKARITARITQHNGETVNREDLDKEVITEAVDKVVVKGTKPVPAKKGTGTFIRPVNVAIYRGYGMRWGRMHEGVDLSAPTGTKIKAADGGTVIMASWYGGYGYCIKIDHGANTTTLYGHCSAMYVSVGEKVYQGQVIGAVGNTGRSTGPHCHFEIKINGVHVNPANYI